MSSALSPQQRAIVRMLCAGLYEREIAERIVLHRSTVHEQVKRLYRALDVGSRGELAVVAAKEGLLVRMPVWSELIASEGRA